MHITTPVLIYQMGKVASSTIYHSLVDQYPGAVASTHRIGSSRRDWRAPILHDWAVNQKHKLHIISPIREPIGRNISGFFYTLDFAQRRQGIDLNEENFELDELKNLFLSDYNHQIPLTWFDENINANFGIDVYSQPFPSEGFAIYEKDNISLMVIRVDLDDTLKSRIIADFIGLPELQLTKINSATESNYRVLYKDFVEQVKLPEDYLNEMLDSRYFKHFFTEADRTRLMNRWSEAA